MASKRAVRRKACRGKVAYTDLDGAKHAASRTSKRLDTPMWAYACKHCGKWHIGHPGRRRGET